MYLCYFQFSLVQFLDLSEESFAIFTKFAEPVFEGHVNLLDGAVVVVQLHTLVEGMHADIVSKHIYFLTLEPLQISKPDHEPLNERKV